MPPKASTSRLPAPAAVKPPAATAAKRLTAQEKRVYELGLAQDSMLLTQDTLTQALGIDAITEEVLQTLNSLARKRLFTVHKLQDGQLSWKAVEIATVQTQSALTDECVLVLDMIKQAGDKAMWSKSIKERSSLPQKELDKSIKHLEAQKLIRSIKSVKYPTRKMYILEGLTPSIELTGGPWYSGSDFDSALISVLLDVSTQYIQKHSLNAESTTKDKDKETKRTIFRLDCSMHTPFLPTAYDVTRYIKSTKCTNAPLETEHIEELLEVLRLDNVIERIKVRREYGEYDSDGEEEQDAANERQRKRLKREASDNLDGSDSDTNMNAVDPGRPGPPGRSKFYYVYRALPQRNENLDIFIGLVDGPCGNCPVASTCDNKGRPAFEDRSLSELTVDVRPNPSKLSAKARDKALITLKPPGSIVTDGSGPWTGGGTRGKQRIGPVNPIECTYFTRWFGQEE